MSENQPLNSNPEVLLRKRRNADRTRLEKQEQARKRKEQEQKAKRDRKQRFVRAETIVAKSLATEREKKRIKRIRALENKKTLKDLSHIPSDRDFILKVTERKAEEVNGEEETIDDDEENARIIKEKIAYDGKPTLVFVVRIKGPTAARIPKKVSQVLTMLRLKEINDGVFLKLTKESFPLLKLVSPYIVIGQPSLSSIRSLILKRSTIMYQVSGEKEPKQIILNDNNIVEEKLGNEGIVCIEDIIHEIATLGESFAQCVFFLQPFKLNKEVSGFSAIARLNRLKLREHHKQAHQHSNAATAPIIQVDMDSLISKLN